MDYTLLRIIYTSTAIVIALFFIKGVFWDKLKAKVQKDSWSKKSKEIITDVQKHLSRIELDVRDQDMRLRKLEDIAKSRNDDISEINIKLDLLFTGIYAILADDNHLKTQAKKQFDNALSFKGAQHEKRC